MQKRYEIQFWSEWKDVWVTLALIKGYNNACKRMMKRKKMHPTLIYRLKSL